MKKLKIFGFGAAALMVLLAVTPAVNSIPIKTGGKMSIEEVLQIFEQHNDAITEIETYIQDYISENGSIDENFTLPPYLETKYYATVTDLQNYVNDHQGGAPSIGGGNKNGFEIEIFQDILGYGLRYKLWLDHFWTTVLNYLGPAGSAAVAIIVTLVSGGLAAPIAVTIAGLLITFGIDALCDLDEGFGIYIFIKHYLIPISLIFVEDAGPQSGGGGGGSSIAELRIRTSKQTQDTISNS